MKSKFNELQKKRRSIYAIGENVTDDKNEIFDLVKTTIQQSPTEQLLLFDCGKL